MKGIPRRESALAAGGTSPSCLGKPLSCWPGSRSMRCLDRTGISVEIWAPTHHPWGLLLSWSLLLTVPLWSSRCGEALHFLLVRDILYCWHFYRYFSYTFPFSKEKLDISNDKLHPCPWACGCNSTAGEMAQQPAHDLELKGWGSSPAAQDTCLCRLTDTPAFLALFESDISSKNGSVTSERNLLSVCINSKKSKHLQSSWLRCPFRKCRPLYNVGAVPTQMQAFNKGAVATDKYPLYL